MSELQRGGASLGSADENVIAGEEISTEVEVKWK